ncbi:MULTISPECIES: hypothetical protein [Streptomyces]|uniref:Uncharacterized protein n=1 Tax=Streptomyces venezuelae TaxID=54571 RepID=A0A5P2BCU6_STRVZ|nr:MULTISPECIES: hypothetical protein [Streptomyces]NEA04237.1 hypothetical protein [Streptomyces sp. SID10116]MYY86715.1 hypothetical protein [Streptomyces sp. SID335]MYZ19291.1 hypothetical protein [Streptomyces sp. SID337]NDZ90081.1 hypothetical protein [Streptomyces sp. SID10115]NEB44510.1 hypothetical protein [Streptomyces sp. SID339]
MTTGRENSGALSAGICEFPTLTSAAFDWLARAQAEPRQAHQEWEQGGAALLPLGSRFNAVRLSAPLVHASIGSTDLDTVTTALAELLDGPVIHNGPQRTYHALVEPYPPAKWGYAGFAPMLGIGQFLSVPAADRTDPTGLHWAVQPHTVGGLCAVPAVAVLVDLGRQRLMGTLR